MENKMTWTMRDDLPDMKRPHCNIEGEQEMQMKIILEGYRFPLRLELARHVIPALIAALFFGVALGYAWRMAQIGG